MGNQVSNSNSGADVVKKTHAQIFTKEFEMLSGIVTSLINSRNMFNEEKYNFLSENVCDSFSLMLESELKKHLKVELKDLNDKVVFIKKTDAVKIKDDYLDKNGLCKIITSHYTKILQLISLIKLVYDIEHNGEKSLAGITLRNISENGGILRIQYCNLAQKDPNAKSGLLLDFSQLMGLKYFCDNFLDKKEKNTLLKNMKILLARDVEMKELSDRMICGDSLIGKDVYGAILGKHAKGVKCNEMKRTKFNETVSLQKEEDMMFAVAAMNPVLDKSVCAESNVMMILKTNKVAWREVYGLYEKLQKDYVKNINAVLVIMNKLVSKVGNGFVLNNIGNDELDKLRIEAKTLISTFYIQTIINYHDLLESAKKYHEQN